MAIANDKSTRGYFDRRRGAMTTERSSFIEHYRDLSQFTQPRRGRFDRTDRNQGQRRHQFIINDTGTQALRTARAGLLAGTMSPARPWFSMIPPDLDMLEFQPVKIWLHKIEEIIREILNASNFYSMVSSTLADLLLFGTGCMSHVDDFDDVARFYTHPPGAYMIAQDDRYVVNTLAREFQMTVLQMVEKFGLNNVSRIVKDLYDRGDYEPWVDVNHFIEPNPDADPSKDEAKFKTYRSNYYEEGNDSEDEMLRISGFDEFPAHIPRWDVTGEDIYGTDCPGMTALGGIKGLQIEERRKAQGIDKNVNPPLHGPASLRNVPIANLPGGLTIYDDGGEGNRGLRPIYQVAPQLQDMIQDIKEVERRIKSAFYVDMFLAISDIEGIQPRNEFDLQHRDRERLLQLGPALEHLQGELQAPTIERVFAQAVRAGIFPPAPPELEGAELSLRFSGTLAAAQRAAAIGPITQVANFTSQLSAVWPEARDKFDADQAIDEVAHAAGAPPRIVVPDDVVAQLREQRRLQQEAAQAQQDALVEGQAAESASKASLEGDNLLTRALGTRQ
jgi:hypothetical protein